MGVNIHMRYSLTMLFVAFVLLLSCSDLRDDMSGATPEVNYVALNVTLPKTQIKKDIVKSGVSDEEITISTLRVYAFSQGRNVGHFYQETPISQNILMDIDMYGIDKETGMQILKFYIVANENAMVMEEDMPDFDSRLSEQQLNDMRFIALDQTGTVPMFYADTVMINTSATVPIESMYPGVIIDGHQDHRVLARKLSFMLKRPFGKISFAVAKLSEDTPDVYINEVNLLARGTRHYNYLMPQSEQTLQSIASRKNDRPFLEEGQTIVVTKLMAEGYADIAESYCFEVPYGSPSPQYWNIPNSYDSAVLKVTYSIGLGEILRTTFIYLPPILRNEWVKVNCTISGEGQVSVNYNVKDWEYEMTDTNGDGVEDFIIFDYPTHTYLLPHMPTPENPEPDPDGLVKVLPQMSVSKPFTCYFQMLYPEGQMWKPTIISSDVSSSDFEISVYNGDTDVLALPDDEGSYGLNASHSSYYRIEVRPLEASNVGKSLRLGITSEIQGFGHSEYLLINGSQAELFWPSEGGSDPNALKITQIE